MAGGAASSGRRGAIVGINITPMVDVMLVLLVILMVSANYIVEKKIRMELPKASTGESLPDSKPPAKPLEVSVRKDGVLFVGPDEISPQALGERLKSLAARDPEQVVVISGDAETDHGKIVGVVDLARTSGLRKFAITVQSR